MLIYKLKGLMLLSLGCCLIIAAICLNVMWIAFCFGTVIIGIALLLFATPVLLLPYFIVSKPGWILIERGLLVYKRISL